MTIQTPSPPNDAAGTTPDAVSAGEVAVADPRVRRLRFLIYTLVLVTSILQMAVVPLLPSYEHRFQLSGLQTAALLAATGLASLAVSVPAGALSDRLGARKLTLWAGWLIAVAVLVQAFAPSYPLLLTARLVFGVGYGVVWTAALAWLASASPHGSALGGIVTVSGVGGIVGPAFAGFVAEYLGLAAPFVVAAGLMALLTAMLTSVRLEGGSSAPRTGLVADLRLAVGNAKVLGAAAAVVVAGSTYGASALLVPLELHASGASAAAIGVVFSAAAVLYIVGSATTNWLGRRAVRLRTVLAAAAVLTVAITPATASAAPVALVAMLCATSATRSVLWTTGYPLGATGANETGVGVGVVMGLLNGVWALTAVVSPLVAGALVGRLGAQATFGLTQVALGAGLLIGWFALRVGGPVRRLLVA